MIKHFFILLTIFSNIISVLSEECEVTEVLKPVATEKKLRDDLLCNYNKHFVPLHNRSEVLNIAIAMQIFTYHINDFGLPKKLHLQNEITVKWNDAFLIWNPSDYDSITELEMSTDEIWSPQIMPEEMEFFSTSTSILTSTSCTVLSSGNVTCTLLSYHTGFCISDERRWPYDEHTCELQYMVWSSIGEELQIDPPANDTLTVRVTGSESDWVITGRSTEFWESRPQLSLTISEMYFQFTLRRNLKSLMQFFSLSIFVITSLSLMCFWSNFESSDRLILCLINIICHIWEIQNMEWKLPRLGHTVPYFLCFYRDSMAIALIILIESMVFKKILTSDKPTPSWLETLDRKLGREIIARILFVDGIVSLDSKNTEQGSFEDELKFIKQRHQLEKKRIILILDRIVFVGFVVAYFIMITILLTF